MRRGKADRWDKLVERLPDDNGWVRSVDAAWLLRREHLAVVRIVRKEILYPVGKSERCEGWNQALQCILELLNARAR